MKKLEIKKNCEYCKSKVAHIIVLADESGESHVHAPSEKNPWFSFLIGVLNIYIKNLRNKKGK